MALSWETCLMSMNNLLSISTSIDDGWTMIKNPYRIELPENCYLSKKVIVKNPTRQVMDKYLLLEENIEDDVTSLLTNSTETFLWEYHILYSPSYSVPVLYFNVRTTAGKLLSLEEVWNLLNVPSDVLVEKWNFVSQQEHPILLRPFFYLHPCKSYEFFKISEHSNVNPLVTWLSSIAHIVNLKMPLIYGTNKS